jgi:hypothetical protein
MKNKKDKEIKRVMDLLEEEPSSTSGKKIDINKTVEEIAKRVLGLENLETRMSDNLDFCELGVWSIKAALVEAYRAGQRS